MVREDQSKRAGFVNGIVDVPSWYDEYRVSFMAKLQKYVRSAEEKARVRRLFEDALSESDDEKLSNEVAEHVVSHGPLYYIERYRATGEYYDIDYPGGMLGLIADYEAGLIPDEQ